MISRLTLTLIFVALIAGCGESNQENSPQQEEEQVSKQTALADSPTLWRGDPGGYVSTADPEADTTAYLIAVGTVDAHMQAYRDSAQGRGTYNLGSSDIVALIDDGLMQTYKSFEARAIRETSLNTSLEADIKLLKSAEFVTALDSGPNQQLPEWSLLNDRFKYWFDGAVEGVKGRDTRVILLSQSALLRKAGDAFAKGIDVNSNPVDPVQENLGYGFLHAALDMSRLSMQFCDAERDALKAVREGGYDLRGKLAEKTAGVSEMYALAAEAEKLANTFPENGDACSSS